MNTQKYNRYRFFLGRRNFILSAFICPFSITKIVTNNTNGEANGEINPLPSNKDENLILLGGLPMSEDPKFGVVNKNLQIHGFKNIYVTGSSVFPTGGGNNSTLTIVMLSERLGHHLSKN